MKLDVRYYLIAIWYPVALDIALPFHRAVVLPEVGMFAFWSMTIVLAILVIALIYEGKRTRWNGIRR